MEEQIAQLIIENESLKMRLGAVEEALLNIVGFYREESDGGQQGQIKFGTPKTQVPPVAKEVTE